MGTTAVVYSDLSLFGFVCGNDVVSRSLVSGNLVPGRRKYSTASVSKRTG